MVPDNYHFSGVKPFSTKLWSFIFKHITCHYFFNCSDYHHGVIHIVVLLWFKNSLKSKDLLLIKLSLFSLLQTYASNFSIACKYSVAAVEIFCKHSNSSLFSRYFNFLILVFSKLISRTSRKSRNFVPAKFNAFKVLSLEMQTEAKKGQAFCLFYLSRRALTFGTKFGHLHDQKQNYLINHLLRQFSLKLNYIEILGPN